MTLCVCVIPVFTGKAMAVDPKTGDIPMDEKPFSSPAVGVAFTVLKYLIMLGLYAGALTVVYGGIQVCLTVKDWLSWDLHILKEALTTATLSMNFAPMLAVLFIGARMRALQMDPVNGAPQKWAQNCFFMCTYALLAQTCLC